MSIQTVPLPYALDSLAPYLSIETLRTHYEKHYAAYVKNTNQFIEGTRFQNLPLDEIVFETAHSEGDEKKIFHNAAQAWNHAFYWKGLTPPIHNELPTLPNREFGKAIQKTFNGVSAFQKLFNQTAVELFGSGWVWLVENELHQLSVLGTKDADCPITEGQTPLLVCDVWEHAYYLDYRSERNRYLDNFWKIVNWKFVEENYHLGGRAQPNRPTLLVKASTTHFRPTHS